MKRGKKEERDLRKNSLMKQSKKRLLTTTWNRSLLKHLAVSVEYFLTRYLITLAVLHSSTIWNFKGFVIWKCDSMLTSHLPFTFNCLWPRIQALAAKARATASKLHDKDLQHQQVCQWNTDRSSLDHSTVPGTGRQLEGSIRWDGQDL